MKNKRLLKVLATVTLGAVAASSAFLFACGHEHTYSEDWSSDATNHWHAATCDDTDEKDSLGAHTDADKDGKCDVCGYTMSTSSSDTSSGTGTADSTSGTTTETPTETPSTPSTETPSTPSTETPTVTVTEISTKAELLAFRANASPSGTYKLTKDIDLEGETLEAPTVVISSGVTFDGNGHTISNGTYANAGAKTGLLCASINGGTVTNVKFLNCVVTSSNESAAILAGECEGTSTISKIEFNSCSVTTSGNYAGLLFARNETANTNITISEITSKNGCTTACSQYGGFLIGDIVGTTTVSFKDLCVEGEFKTSSGNGAFIAGRTREGAIVSVENAVINATGIANSGNNALISGGSNACSKITLKNILVLGSAGTKIAKTSPSDSVYTNVAVASGVTISGYTSATEGTNSYTWLTANGFSSDVWMAEGTTGGYRLIASSTNVRSADATLTAIKVSTSNATTRFKKGEEFSSSGVVVMGVYSDGVQLVLSQDATDGYTIDSSAYNKDTANNTDTPSYTITVKSKEDETKTQTYAVTVVQQTGINIDDTLMDHVYLKGSILDTTNLVVYSVWSDGVQEKITNGYTVTSNDGASSVKLTTVGTQTVTVASSGFDSKTTNISVIDTTPTAVDGKLYVNVDADFTASYNGAQVNGVETFTSVKDAIDYLEACVADNSSLADVQKVVRIGAGTYKAKITTDLKNLALIGTATKTVNSNTVVDPNATVLTYDAVESTVNPVNGTQYSLECATLQVNGSGFTAYNITIKNSFNYIADSKKESSPQGIALTINGDQAVISNCVLYGNQDTLYLKKGRAYFKDTEIDGNIDFIFGESTGLAYFDTCTIKAITKSTAKEKNNGYVTAMKASSENKPDYGYIFSNCTFTDDGNLADGSMSLGRPWGAAATVAYINCSFTKAYSTAAYDGTTKSRWYEMSGNSPVNADFCEYGSTGDGAITTAVTGGKVLTTEQAANYTKANIFAKENGKCSWSAAWDCGAAYDAVANLKVLDTATELYVSSTSITVNEKETAALAISVNKWNASDKGVTIEVANPAIATYSNGKVTGVAAGTTTITVSKSGFESKTVTVNVAPADLTISETLSTYVFGTQLPPEVTTANTTSYLGKIKIDTGTSGTFVKHDDNYYKLMGTASITLKVKAGSILTLATYDNELALTLNGTDVTANGAYSATSGDCTYTYTVAADGDLVLKLADGKNQLYLTSLGVYVPTVISKTTVLDLTTTDGATEALKYINVNGTMTENSSGGNYRVERGTVLTIYAAKGSTAAITWYSDTEVQYGSDNNVSIVTTDSTDYTVITLTFHADTDETRNDGSNGCYIKKITVTAPQAAQPASKTYTYTYGETNGSEWVATTTNYQNNPNDATISGLLLAPNDYLTLTASGTSATITLTGFTRKTNTPGEWVTVEFLDAEGNVVGSCKGTPPSNKNNDKIFDAKTFSCESGKSFTKIRVTCNTADKNFSVSAATIVVE